MSADLIRIKPLPRAPVPSMFKLAFTQAAKFGGAFGLGCAALGLAVVFGQAALTGTAVTPGVLENVVQSALLFGGGAACAAAAFVFKTRPKKRPDKFQPSPAAGFKVSPVNRK